MEVGSTTVAVSVRFQGPFIESVGGMLILHHYPGDVSASDGF